MCDLSPIFVGCMYSLHIMCMPRTQKLQVFLGHRKATLYKSQKKKMLSNYLTMKNDLTRYISKPRVYLLGIFYLTLFLLPPHPSHGGNKSLFSQ